VVCCLSNSDLKGMSWVLEFEDPGNHRLYVKNPGVMRQGRVYLSLIWVRYPGIYISSQEKLVPPSSTAIAAIFFCSKQSLESRQNGKSITLLSNFPLSIPFTQLRTRWIFIIKNSRVNGHWARLTRLLPLLWFNLYNYIPLAVSNCKCMCSNYKIILEVTYITTADYKRQNKNTQFLIVQQRIRVCL